VVLIGWRVENVIIVFHCPQTIASSHVFLSYIVHLYWVASFAMGYGLKRGNGFLLTKDEVTDVLHICSPIRSFLLVDNKK